MFPKAVAQGSGVSGWRLPQSLAAQELGTPQPRPLFVLTWPSIPNRVPRKTHAAGKKRTVLAESFGWDSLCGLGPDSACLPETTPKVV